MRLVYPQTPNSAVPPVVEVDHPPAPAVPTIPADAPIAQATTSSSKEGRPTIKWKKPRAQTPLDDEDGDDEEIDFDKLERFDDDDDEEAISDDDETPSEPTRDSLPSLKILKRVPAGDGSERLLLDDGRWYTSYEYLRLRNIKRNKTMLKDLGIPEAIKALGTSKPPPGLRPPHLPPTNLDPPSRIPPARASKEGEKM